MFVLKLLFVLCGLGIAALVVWKGIIRINNGWKIKWRRIPVALLLIIAILVVISCFGAVPTGQRGIVLRWGAATGRVLAQGIYFVFPVAERVVVMSVQVKAHITKVEAASKDLQNVTTSVTLNFAVEPDKAATLFRDVGIDYERIIITPAIQEAVKAATAGFDAEKLIVERPLVKEKVTEQLRGRLLQHGIIVDAVSITDFSFSPEFTAAIEAKVTATQKALEAENNLKRVEFEAKQRIAQAQGEAEAIRTQAQAIQTQGGRSYVDLKWIDKWNGALPTTMFGGNATPMVVVPTGGK
jgi:regulator of protease activity HflC (stomatin/prohibitin superfamily)